MFELNTCIKCEDQNICVLLCCAPFYAVLFGNHINIIKQIILQYLQIQGAIILASLFQVAIGMSGLIGIMLKFIGPLAIAPTIALIGISLFGSAADFASQNWWVAIM